MKLLIDTNILIYSFDSSNLNRKEKALEILYTLRNDRSGKLSVQCLAEFFSVITRPYKYSPPKLSPAKALYAITELAGQFETYPLTSMIVLEAGRGARDHQMSYYDAQIWATARLNQVDVVLTEDIPSSPAIEGVQYFNPFTSDLWVSP